MVAVNPLPETTQTRWRWERFAGPLCFLGCILAVVFIILRGAGGDFDQFLYPMDAIWSGKWDQIYPDGSLATSMSGWLVITSLPFVFFRSALEAPDAFAASSIVALPLFFFSFRFAFRSFWPHRSSTEAWILALVAVWLPTTLAAWVEYYHPQDVAGAALLFLAAGCAVKSRWGVSGLLFGFAVMTRQWALLAAIPIAALSGKEIWKFISGAALGSAILLLPIIATGNEGWFEVLTFRPPTAGSNSLLGGLSAHFEINSNKEAAEFVINLSRWIPLFLSAAAGVFVYWKSKMQGYVWPKETIIVLCIYGIALRNMFELFSFAYYWVPVAPLFLLLTPWRKTNWTFVALFGAVPPILSVILPWGYASPGALVSWHTLVWYFILASLALVVPWYSIKPLDDIKDDESSGSSPIKSASATKLAWACVAALFLLTSLGVYNGKLSMNSSDAWKIVDAAKGEVIVDIREHLLREGMDPDAVLPDDQNSITVMTVPSLEP